MRPSAGAIVFMCALLVSDCLVHPQEAWAGQSESPESSHETDAPRTKSIKIMVLYKSGVTASDKKRVRTLINAKVSTRFKDPTMEELAVDVPDSSDEQTFANRSIRELKTDPAVFKAQVAQEYEIK
jgi:hypothetical protein